MARTSPVSSRTIRVSTEDARSRTRICFGRNDGVREGGEPENSGSRFTARPSQIRSRLSES